MDVVRHESPGLFWEFARAEPRPALRPYVRRLVGYRERTALPLARTELPSDTVTLILGTGPAIDVTYEGRDPVRAASFVAGLHPGSVRIDHAGRQEGVQLDLSPFGAALLGLPAGELAGHVIELEDVLGPDARFLAERVAGTAGWPAALAVVQDALEARVAGVPAPAPSLVWAFHRLRRSQGRVTVAELAEETGWSRRHLAGQFRVHVGLSPKTLAGVLRFRRAADLLAATPEGGWAAVAADCGYYDQAHLNRDFRRFAGTSPSAYVARLLPDAGGLVADLPNVQDDGARAA